MRFSTRFGCMHVRSNCTHNLSVSFTFLLSEDKFRSNNLNLLTTIVLDKFVFINLSCRALSIRCRPERINQPTESKKKRINLTRVFRFFVIFFFYVNKYIERSSAFPFYNSHYFSRFSAESTLSASPDLSVRISVLSLAE